MSSDAGKNPDTVARRWGVAAERAITSQSKRVSAAVWRFPPRSHYDLEGRADEHTHLISMPIAGRPHHTYFGDGRQKWARPHPPFHMNIVAAGEKPRGIYVSEQPFSLLHVYLPHSIIEGIADDIAEGAHREIVVIDPMCSRDPLVEAVCRQLIREMSQPDVCTPLVLDCLGQELAIRLLRQHSNVSASRSLAVNSGPGYRDWRLRRAMEYLEARLGGDIARLTRVWIARSMNARTLGIPGGRVGSAGQLTMLTWGCRGAPLRSRLMLSVIAVHGYRLLRDVVLPVDLSTVVKGLASIFRVAGR